MEDFFIAIKWPAVCLLWSIFFVRIINAVSAARHLHSEKVEDLHREIAFWKEKAINFRKPHGHP